MSFRSERDLNMGNPGTDHERFGELSALAIIGQVSSEEYRELKAHLEFCATCRQEHDALARILLTELPLAHEEKDSDLDSWIAAQPTERSMRGHGREIQAGYRTGWRNCSGCACRPFMHTLPSFFCF